MASASPADVTRSSPTHGDAAPPHCGERVGAAGYGSSASRRWQQQYSLLLPWQHRRGISPFSLSPSHRRQTSSLLLPCHPAPTLCCPHPAPLFWCPTLARHGSRQQVAQGFPLLSEVRTSEGGTGRPGPLAWRSQTMKHEGSLLVVRPGQSGWSEE